MSATAPVAPRGPPPKLANRRPDWDLPDLTLDLRLSPHDELEDKSQQRGTCPQCLDHCPEFDPARAVVLFPSPGAMPVEELDFSSVDRIFIIDSRWKKAKTLVAEPVLAGVRHVVLREARTAFWRFHTAGVGDEGVCTIEALLHFFRDLQAAGQLPEEYRAPGCFDDLLWYFAFQHKLVQRKAQDRLRQREQRQAQQLLQQEAEPQQQQEKQEQQQQQGRQQEHGATPPAPAAALQKTAEEGDTVAPAVSGQADTAAAAAAAEVPPPAKRARVEGGGSAGAAQGT